MRQSRGRCVRVRSLEIEHAHIIAQGYARAAALFLRMGKPQASLKMTTEALQRTSDIKRCQDLEACRSEAQQLITLRTCHIEKLPVELTTSIFVLLHSKDALSIFALSLVCRKWRDILRDMPSVWRSLVLSPKTVIKKADVWLERARGTLRSLVLKDGFDLPSHPKFLRGASQGFWERLAVLRIDFSPDIASIDQVLPPGVFRQLRLAEFEFVELTSVATSTLLPDFWLALNEIDPHAVRSVKLGSVHIAPWRQLMSFTALQTLEVIATDVSVDNVLPVLERTANLTRLVLDMGGAPGRLPNAVHNAFPDQLGPLPYVSLPRLEHFALGGPRHDFAIYFTHIRAPNLTSLSISYSAHSVHYLDALVNFPMPHLLTLHLHRCLVNCSVLERVLRATPLLRTLSYVQCFGDPTPDLVKILGSVTEVEGELVDKTVGRTTVLCPALEHVDLSGTQDLEAGFVVRLIKSRLPSASDAQDGSARRPIRSLTINDCPKVDPDALPWLRQNVEKVVCQFTNNDRRSKKTRR